MVLRSLGALLAAAAFFGLSRADVPELPPIPRDLTTPYGQRLAFNGPTGEVFVALSIWFSQLNATYA